MDKLKLLRARVQVGITVVLGLFCLYEIGFPPDNSTLQKWAIGMIGLLIGYWLK